MANWIHAGSVQTLQREGPKVVKGGIVVFHHEDQLFAVDNRCPHMGFPLHMGSLCDGILTCHWHHARFDVCSGGTLDPWADDVPTYDVKVEKGEVWVNSASKNKSEIDKYIDRLRKGLEQNIGLVIAKAVVGLVEAGASDAEIVRVGVKFGTKQRRNGWGSGLTILTTMTNVLPKLDKQGRILALFHGLVHVARDSSGSGTRFLIGPLPDSQASAERLTAWYRNCVEVRDTQGAERVLLTAIRGDADAAQLSAMMLAAVTDHFYLDGGHTLDFHNKAFEILKHIGLDNADQVLTSLVPSLGGARRSEELHSWQSPVDLVSPLNKAFSELESILSANMSAASGEEDGADAGQEQLLGQEQQLLEQILSDQPIRTIEALTAALKGGLPPARLARIVALAAAERIVRFHTQNDFRDWITVLHTFTHAHAVHESLLRADHPLLVRAVYHAAMSIYLDRFLNVPAASRPTADHAAAQGYTNDPSEFLKLLDKQQQVAPAAAWVTNYLRTGGEAAALLNTLGHALLREDAEFHSFQLYEAAVAEYDHWARESGKFAERAKETMLLAAVRYLAAHAPTSRELPHTARIAWRLHRGEKLFEE
jgi:nitrite reductase/ring-hydroxylating ferredoxin subunit